MSLPATGYDPDGLPVEPEESASSGTPRINSRHGRHKSMGGPFPSPPGAAHTELSLLEQMWSGAINPGGSAASGTGNHYLSYPGLGETTSSTASQNNNPFGTQSTESPFASSNNNATTESPFRNNNNIFGGESPFTMASSSFDVSDSFKNPVDIRPLGRVAYHQSIGSHVGGPVVSTPRDDANVDAPPITNPIPASHEWVIISDDGTETATSIIYDAARIFNWGEVLSLCKTHPASTRYLGPDRWTALHHACNRRCPQADVYEALVNAYPDSLLLETEDKGMTPLHYACRFKAPKEAVRILLHTFPSKGHAAAGRRDKRGRTPLFYAVRYDAPPGVVEMLLEVDPSVVSEEDKNADSALGLVWDTWADKFEGKKALMPYIREFEPVLASGDTEAEEEFSNDKEGKKDNILRAHELRAKIMNDPKVAGKWNKVNIFLSAAFKFNPGDNFSATDGNGTTIDGSKKRKWRVLHGVCAIKCHVTLFHMAKALYPEQVFELDENDLYGDSSRKNSADPSHSSHRTALHFAAASPASGKDGKFVISSLLSLHPEAASVADNVDGSLPLHLIAENDNKSHWLHDGVSELHLANPQAVKALDRSGRTPLHRATASLAHRSSSIGDGLQHLPASPVIPTDIERRQHIDVSGSIILNLLEAYPGAASIADTTGRLPLHLIAEHGETWDAEADAILKAHPAAIQTRARPDSHSRLPIHMAALSPDANISLISKLVTSHPRALSQADGMGKLPLHLACEGGLAWENGVGVIYDTYQPAIKETESNTRRWTALHSAAASPNAGGELVAKLTELYPQAAQVRDGKGRYPLHLACVSGKGWEGGVRNIFDAFPDAILARDKSGSLPFHMSALSYCSGTISLNKESDKKIAGTNHADASRTDHTHTLNCGHRTVDDLTKIEILYHLLREQPIVLSHH